MTGHKVPRIRQPVKHRKSTGFKRRFAQHFLEPVWTKKVVHAIQPLQSDCFLEIGPGRGALTWELVKTGATVQAIEIDPDLSAFLAKTSHPLVTVRTGDILSLDLTAIAVESTRFSQSQSPTIRIVGNLPYNISAPILLKLFAAYDNGVQVRDAVVMLQQEMAERLAANHGNRNYGPLAIARSLRADAKILFSLPPGAFRPSPSVTSAIVSLNFRKPPVFPANQFLFESMVRHLFTKRRKQSTNALSAFAFRFGVSALDVFRRARIDGRLRPSELSVADLISLAETIESLRP